MNRNKHLLKQVKSKRDVNQDDFSKIQFNGTERLLPVGDINEIVDVAERFNFERRNSSFYRINATINPLFTNVLFNTTGPNSWASLMGNTFRDMSYPPDAIDLDQEEDLTYKEAIEKHLTNVNGWYGYFDPNIASFNPCAFTDMEPNRELFSLTPSNYIKNWEMCVTYPFENVSGFTTNNGIFIVDKKTVSISGRQMTAFGVPVKHNLVQGSTVKITGLNPIINDGLYTVIRLGLDNGDHTQYYFCLDIPPTTFALSNNPRMVRVFNGKESIYYHRNFKKIKMRFSNEMETDDYEIYPLAFSQNIFNDKMTQFVVNEDIDVSGIVDNLGRPLSELYITFIKTTNNGFTTIKSGIDMPFIDGIQNFKDIPDIRRITNDVVNSHYELEDAIDIYDKTILGDIVEYNSYELIETVLGVINHRFNTINRETLGFVTDPVSGNTINLGIRNEGYIYAPHYKIQIRNFSSYIEQGDLTVEGMPSYAEDLGDGRFLWRDLLDIGVNDVQNNLLDYPFLNGSHYIHKNIMMCVKRQDPFAKYGLYYSLFPRDELGNSMIDNFIVKRVDDVC